MIPITQNPYPLERWSNIQAQFDIIDVDAAENAVATATSENVLSNLSQTHNRNIDLSDKIATFEQDFFLLDGSFKLPDESDNGETGWWSEEISGPDKLFAIPQVLEFIFTQDQSSMGFTIVFDTKANEYMEDFTVQVYTSSDVLLGEDIVTGNLKSLYISDLPVDNYRKVKVILRKTSKPYRRAKVCEVAFGIVKVYNKVNIIDARILYSLSLGTENLSSNELVLTIDNSNKEYNAANPGGVYKFLQQGQPISLKLGVGDSSNNIEMVNMGTFYYTSSKAEDGGTNAVLVANDHSYFLDGNCRIGSDGTWTVQQAVEAILLASGLNISTRIPSDIGSRIVNKWIPQNATYREALRLVAQASMCVCYFDRDSFLVFREIAETDVVDTLNNSNMYKPAKLDDSGRINKVELKVRNDYAGGGETIYSATNKQVGETDKVKTFSNPLVYDGASVANWLLAVTQKRIGYKLQERGNPAREIGDVVEIQDAFGQPGKAIITKQEYSYNGALKASTEARKITEEV